MNRDFPGICTYVPRKVSLPSPPRDDIINLLSIDERIQYNCLVDSISKDVQRVKRCGLSEFIAHVGRVNDFINRTSINSALRGIVCGIEFGKGFILVNTGRFKKVLSRSKSCLNGCFQRLGFDVMKPSHDLIFLFNKLLPNVKIEYFAIRQWCVRLINEESSLCFLPNLTDEATIGFEMQRIPSQKQMFDNFIKNQKQKKENQFDFQVFDIRSLLNRKPIEKEPKPTIVA